MSVFPQPAITPLVTITPFSMEALGGMLGTASSFPGIQNLNNPTSWPVANQALYVPFSLSTPITFSTMFLMVGTASGNVDLGVFDSAGTKIVSTGSTAVSGSTAIQTISVTSTRLAPGQYYLAMSYSASTGSAVFRVLVSNSQFLQAAGCAQQTSSLPLPATATFASITNTFVPMFGLSTRSVV